MLDTNYYREDQLPLPQKPQGKAPMGNKQKILAKAGSLIIATGLWAFLKGHLNNEKGSNISSMQLQAGERGEPMVINTTKNTISTRIAGVITGKEEPESTVIINPPGQEPAIQVITPNVTITADDRGAIKEIIPKESITEPSITVKEAQSTVDEAVKDAAEKTLPKEEPLKPTEPQVEKE